MTIPRMIIGFGAGIGIAAASAAACGGGGGSNPTGPSGASVTTITITPNGVDPKIVTVSAGARVRFVNSDGRMHEMLTTPHLQHTDCPPINQVGTLNSGQSKDTGALTQVRICGYHDHLQPDDTRFRGQINVGTNEGPAPDYRTTR